MSSSRAGTRSSGRTRTALSFRRTTTTASPVDPTTLTATTSPSSVAATRCTRPHPPPRLRFLAERRLRRDLARGLADLEKYLGEREHRDSISPTNWSACRATYTVVRTVRQYDHRCPSGKIARRAARCGSAPRPVPPSCSQARHRSACGDHREESARRHAYDGRHPAPGACGRPPGPVPTFELGGSVVARRGLLDRAFSLTAHPKASATSWS